ncbi:HemK2/MTQ2 family protein methyltransferase [Streptomyces sp. NPDC051109]|uniref:HemK2/MTQ2 family protein methyltransferase n=1 Tax=Streptomyces sp. NPDC051109 TaxID=3365642 RepID=UPI003794C8EB
MPSTALACSDPIPRPSWEPVHDGARVVELGTGTGALALCAAARGADVTAVDVAWPAVLAARLNGWLHRTPLRVLHGDFASRTEGQRFDPVLANPPYAPSPDSRLPASGARPAWDAGSDGRAVIDRICDMAPVLLYTGGVLLLVHSGMCRAQETLERLTRAGLTARVAERVLVPWGSVLRSRRQWLQPQGLAAAGDEQEELVITGRSSGPSPSTDRHVAAGQASRAAIGLHTASPLCRYSVV